MTAAGDVFDVAVIGGGIAGVSLAFELARRGTSTVLLEREPALAVHSTGRSAAQYIESYGGPGSRALTSASWDFLASAAEGLADAWLIEPRPVMWVVPNGMQDQIPGKLKANRRDGVACEQLSTTQALQRCGALDPEWLAGAVFEPDGFDIDVAGLHQAFLRGALDHDAVVVLDFRVRRLQRRSAIWHVEALDGRSVSVTVVVNAAGAWCDQVALLAGAVPLGIQPYRRTVFVFGAGNYVPHDWPLVVGIDESFYFKPEGRGQILASPADERPEQPCDVRPREIDVARGIEAVNTATTFGIRSVRSTWAGLRSFAPDHAPVFGFDPQIRGFFWCGGQGGTGIQTSPAAARLCAALISGEPPEPELAETVEVVSPSRFSKQ